MSANPDPGSTRLEEAVRGLDALDRLPVDKHPAVYDEIHHAMREVLAGAHDA